MSGNPLHSDRRYCARVPIFMSAKHRRPRSAGFQPAVSPISNRHASERQARTERQLLHSRTIWPLGGHIKRCPEMSARRIKMRPFISSTHTAHTRTIGCRFGLSVLLRVKILAGTHKFSGSLGSLGLRGFGSLGHCLVIRASSFVIHPLRNARFNSLLQLRNRKGLLQKSCPAFRHLHVVFSHAAHDNNRKPRLLTLELRREVSARAIPQQVIDNDEIKSPSRLPPNRHSGFAIPSHDCHIPKTSDHFRCHRGDVGRIVHNQNPTPYNQPRYLNQGPPSVVTPQPGQELP
jgi:hypothetical protein